ncbi:MAG TPA: hypothetical protein VJA94_25830 [Candidatus Angelobacter sp.]
MGFHRLAAALLITCAWPLLWSADVRVQRLPAGILNALSEDEAQSCRQVSGKFEKSCHRNFLSHLRWRELLLTPSGTAGVLVENRNQGFCGSAGCALYLFVAKPDRSFVVALDEIGTVQSVKVLKTITRGHYDLKKTWSDGKTIVIYRWDGSLYSHD